MALYDALIDDLVCGDDYSLVRTITLVPVDTSLSDAWLTVKRARRDPDAQALFQLHITTTESAAGHITDSGAGDETAEVAFELASANTAKMLPLWSYAFDLQVKTASGKVYTPLVGHLRAHAGVTRATS